MTNKTQYMYSMNIIWKTWAPSQSQEASGYKRIPVHSSANPFVIMVDVWFIVKIFGLGASPFQLSTQQLAHSQINCTSQHSFNTPVLKPVLKPSGSLTAEHFIQIALTVKINLTDFEVVLTCYINYILL